MQGQHDSVSGYDNSGPERCSMTVCNATAARMINEQTLNGNGQFTIGKASNNTVLDKAATKNPISNMERDSESAPREVASILLRAQQSKGF